jgi:hypothetical protein
MSSLEQRRQRGRPVPRMRLNAATDAGAMLHRPVGKVTALVSAGCSAWHMWGSRLAAMLAHEANMPALIVRSAATLPLASLLVLMPPDHLRRVAVMDAGDTVGELVSTLEAAAECGQFSCVVVDTPAWLPPIDKELRFDARRDVAEIRRALRLVANGGTEVFVALPRSRVHGAGLAHGDLVGARDALGLQGQAYRIAGGTLWIDLADRVVYHELDTFVGPESPPAA